MTMVQRKKRTVTTSVKSKAAKEAVNNPFKKPMTLSPALIFDLITMGFMLLLLLAVFQMFGLTIKQGTAPSNQAKESVKDESSNNSQDTNNGSVSDIEGIAKRIEDPKVVSIFKLRENDLVYGNKDSDILVFELIDFECPFCERIKDYPKQIVKKYDAGWVYRHFTLSFHEPQATLEANAAECVYELGGADAFIKFHDNILGAKPSKDELKSLASQVGVDSEKFSKCLEAEKYTAKANQQEKESTEALASYFPEGLGTPTMVITSKKDPKAVYVIVGAVPIDRVEKVIDKIK